MRNILRIIPFVLLLGYANLGKAQSIDSTLQEYSTKFPQERIYFHFDKSSYFPGDTIWYKAYLLSGWSLSGISKNLYTDWVDASGKLVMHGAGPIVYATSYGQMIVPKNYQENVFHLHAYTGWMLNFDPAFLFDKDIPIIQPQGIAQYKLPAHTVRVSLLPEGGNMVQSLTSAVAFKAENQSGRPVNITGALRNKSGEVIDSIASEHDGMGKFFLAPEAGEVYSVLWKDNLGDSGTTQLAAAQPAGALLKVSVAANKVSFHIDRSADAPANFKKMYVLGTMQQQQAFKFAVDLDKAAGATNSVPTSQLADGILQVTLFDANWKPVAERVVFVNNNDYSFKTGINITKKGLGKRGLNEVEIEVPDSTASTLSLSVTDGGLLYDSSYNIVSHLLLTSDIKGYVNNPAYYFSNNSDSVKAHLDLVMLTNGWRKYNWDNIVAGKLPAIKYKQDTTFIAITGLATKGDNTAAEEGTSVFLNVRGRDEADSLHSVFTASTNNDGTFVISPGAFYDSAYINYKLVGAKKTENRGAVSFTSSLLAPLNNYSSIHITASSLQDSLSLLNALAVKTRADELYKVLGQLTLKNVTVTAKAKTPIKKLDEEYASPTFQSANTGNTYSFDVAHDPDAKGLYSLSNYLMDKIPGLQVQSSGSPPVASYLYRPRLSISGAAQGVVRVFLDELETDNATLATIQLNDVGYIKFYKSGALVTAADQPSLVVYTRIGNEGNGLSSFKQVTVAGYTQVKEFYSPSYAAEPDAPGADVRTTLYWNPNILAGGKVHKVKFVFYNNDVTKKLRFVLEGVNASGQVTRVEKTLE